LKKALTGVLDSAEKARESDMPQDIPEVTQNQIDAKFAHYLIQKLGEECLKFLISKATWKLMSKSKNWTSSSLILP